MTLTFAVLGPALNVRTFDVLSPPNLSPWTVNDDPENTISVLRFVVAVLPKTRKVFMAVVFAYILEPIDNVSVGERLDIPVGAVPVVRSAFILTLLFITTGVSVPGFIVRRFPTSIPPNPIFNPCVKVFPVTSRTFDPVSSTKNLEPTQRS